jgi:hypothetical protein
MLLPSFWQGILMKDDLGYVAAPVPQSPQRRPNPSRIERPLVLQPEYWGELPPLHPINLNIKSEKIAALRLKYRRDSLWLTTSTSERPTPPTQPMLEPTVLLTVVPVPPQPIKKHLHRPSPLVRIPEMGRVNIPHYQEKSIGQLLGLS